MTIIQIKEMAATVITMKPVMELLLKKGAFWKVVVQKVHSKLMDLSLTPHQMDKGLV